MINYAENLSSFFNQIQKQFEQAEYKLKPHWDIDHACYRVGTVDKYFELKKQFSEQFTFLGEAQVNGRPISTFKMKRAVACGPWCVDVIELAAPKLNNKYAEGFEHIEVTCDESFDDIKKQFPQAQFEISGAKKIFNAELELKLSAGAVKFHHVSLESVVCLESNKKIWHAIENSQVLNVLKKFQPLIAGTYALGLSDSDSDVDVIAQCANFQDIKKTCTKTWGDLPQFHIKEDTAQDHKIIIVNFSFEDVSIEVFAQELPALQQRAYQHFLVEEKLLKYGGEKLKIKILENRRSGLKTEPAFASALGIGNDAYQELESMQKWSIKALREFLEMHGYSI